MRRRVGDKRILALIKAFLKAGIMSADGEVRDSVTETRQGGIASALLANVALSALDDHFCARWEVDGGASARPSAVSHGRQAACKAHAGGGEEPTPDWCSRHWQGLVGRVETMRHNQHSNSGCPPLRGACVAPACGDSVFLGRS